MRLAAVLAAALALVSVGGCFPYLRGDRPRQRAASCESACDHYLACRQTTDPELERGCLTECRSIFVSDGVADEGSLREFEELECYDAVAFVEGPSGRPPGGPVATGGAHADRKR